MTDLPLVCPAARPVHPPHDEPGVICGVIELSNDGAHIGGWSQRGKVPGLISGGKNPNIVHNLCAGQGVPGSGCSYTECVYWKAERERIAAARKAGPDGLIDEQAHRPPDHLTNGKTHALIESLKG